MQYFDLNIQPNANEVDQVTSINELITNLITTHTAVNALPKLDYDEKSNLLKITDKHAQIRLASFMLNNNSNPDFNQENQLLFAPVRNLELIECVASLYTKNIKIKMLSKNIEASLIIAPDCNFKCNDCVREKLYKK